MDVGPDGAQTVHSTNIIILFTWGEHISFVLSMTEVRCSTMWHFPDWLLLWPWGVFTRSWHTLTLPSISQDSVASAAVITTCVRLKGSVTPGGKLNVKVMMSVVVIVCCCCCDSQRSNVIDSFYWWAHGVYTCWLIMAGWSLPSCLLRVNIGQLTICISVLFCSVFPPSTSTSL